MSLFFFSCRFLSSYYWLVNLSVYLQVDKNLAFLNAYVQQSIEEGAQPYISENERSGALSISNFGNQTQHEPSAHGLRFEAYELSKPIEQSKPNPVSSHVPPNELVLIPEPSYAREILHDPPVRPLADSGSNEIKLRLDGVQKKWGRPNYSSAPSTSNSSSQNAANGASQLDTSGTISSKSRDPSYNSQKLREIDPKKQKLAASLFGGISKAEKRPSSISHKSSNVSGHVGEKSGETKSVPEVAPSPPPPDLLDLDGPDNNGSSSSVIDPFTQLEGLLEVGSGASSTNISSPISSTNDSDLMALYGDITSAQPGFVDTFSKDDNLLFGSSNDATKNGNALQQSQGSKGPNLKEALQKDALVRQLGVTPTSQNPNLFKDLFG